VLVGYENERRATHGSRAVFDDDDHAPRQSEAVETDRAMTLSPHVPYQGHQGMTSLSISHHDARRTTGGAEPDRACRKREAADHVQVT